MKKIIAIALLATACSSVAFAKPAGFTGPSDPQTTVVQGGFNGLSNAFTTVEQAKQLRDDTDVILRGHIERHLSGKKYLFKDESGSITIDISRKEWNGLTVGPNDLIEIYGEVEKDWNSIQIDVDFIKKVQ